MRRIQNLALSIEQSKLILGTFAQYQGGREAITEMRGTSRGPDSEERSSNREPSSRAAGGPRKTDGTQGSCRVLTESRKCYNRSKYGHVVRECPLRVARVSHIEPKHEAPTEKDETLSSRVNRTRCLGMAVKENGSSANDLIRDRVMVPLHVLGEKFQALIDTGSMISIVPVQILAKIQDRGFDLDSLIMVPKSKLKPVFDASDNRMDFLAASKERLRRWRSILVQRRKLRQYWEPMRSLGINIAIEKERVISPKEAKQNNVMTLCPTWRYGTTRSGMSGERDGEVERVIRPCKQGVAAGVFTIKDQRTTIPVVSKSSKPLLLKEGEDIGHWGTDKWLERWEDANPLMVNDEKEAKLTASERESLASIDTGSVRIIVPVQILAKIHDRGFDLDSLIMVPKSKLKPVFDASDNKDGFPCGCIHTSQIRARSD
ncbi:hypothetical protein OSTOST_02472 [Ostertagia ostertagi]